MLLGIALAALGAASASAVADVDLEVTKERTGGAGPVAVGEEATFRLTVSNAGTTDATGVTVVDTLPAGLTPVGASSGCTTAGQMVTCALTLPLGQFDHPFFDVRARAEPVAVRDRRKPRADRRFRDRRRARHGGLFRRFRRDHLLDRSGGSDALRAD